MYKYTAALSDKGTFTTLRGALRPNQVPPSTGKHIIGVVRGTVSGKSLYTFYASAKYPITPRLTFGLNPQNPYWLRVFFGHRTYVGPPVVISSVTEYHAQKGFMRTWIVARYTNNGQARNAGNITGGFRHHR